MTRLTYKAPCYCQRYPEDTTFRDKSGRCYICNNLKELPRNYELPDNVDMNWTEIEYGQGRAVQGGQDLSQEVECPCGENVFVMGSEDIHICVCGRIYKQTVQFVWDETYVGRVDEIKKLCSEK
jgi:hypothetical protein